MSSSSDSLDPRDGSAHALDLRDVVNAAFAASTIDRGKSDDTAPLPDAIDDVLTLNPTVDGEGDSYLIPPVAINEARTPMPADHPASRDGPVLERDRETLREIARYRLVSFAHLKEFLFPHRHGSVLTRRMQALTRAGFVTTWEEHLVFGGHPRFALLTPKGLSIAIGELRAASVGHPHERLVAFMLRSGTPKPLILAPRTAPPFLRHQVETNRLAATFAHTPALEIIWASAWHRPFPNSVHGIALPQPDAVLVGAVREKPHLFFLEHDRGQESPGSFAGRKTQRYQLLLDLGLAPELLGFEHFTVLVTVADLVRRKPLERIRALQEVSAASPVMRFTPAGWAHATPTSAVWFASNTPIRTSSLRPGDHAGLDTPFSKLDR